MNAVATSADSVDQRRAVYDVLLRRNRRVSLLRIGLPALGLLLAGVLTLQLYVNSLIPDFGFADILIDRNNLVVEAPAYSGVGDDGTVYSVAAERAKTALGNTDLIDLTGAALSMTQPNGTTFAAHAQSAQLKVSEQLITVDGATDVKSSNGLVGTIGDAVVDVLAERLVATDGADLTLGSAGKIKADTMVYEGRQQLWRFTNVIVDFNTTPGEASYGLRPGSEVTP